MTPMFSPATHWRRLYGWDRFAECLRVFLALAGIMLYGWIAGQLLPTVPMLLGAIACALAETEDRWQNRLPTLLVTLLCFGITALSVEWLISHPPLFAVGLWLSTFALVMLGALDGRYATIAGATLILAVYTMIGADLASGPSAHLLTEPLRLLAGAAWYGLLSLLWSALSPDQAVRHSLARSFDALADQLDGKAVLFLPVHGLDHQALQLDLAMRNEKTVQSLNASRLVLIDRIGRRRARGNHAALLQRYLAAQDIHERINSSHYPHDALARAFFHSDVLFRCEHLLRLQAGQCRRRARSLRLRTGIEEHPAARAALEDFRTAVAAVASLAQPRPAELSRALDGLVNNLAAIHDLLDDQLLLPPGDGSDDVLHDPAPQSAADAWLRIRAQFGTRSPRFRHGVRLATALLAGYLVLLLAHPRHGYWILLTTLFVCQPSYHATWRVMLQRVGGTIAGLVLGWALLRSLPLLWQLPLVVLTGVGFFATWRRRYAVATGSITLFVVLLVNQVGNGYAVMGPRLLDTLIGAAIAALAIRLILPDWQQRKVSHVLADTLRSDAGYLAQILPQYRHGRRDHLDYRVARRAAHNANAALSGLLANMLREPESSQQRHRVLLRFLTAAHVLLSHLSTLGAHRRALGEGAANRIEAAGAALVATLEHLADQLDGDHKPPARAAIAVPPDIGDSIAGDDGNAILAQSQLALVSAQCVKLAALMPELPAD